MTSTIKCVSCKQRINLAPDARGIVTCPMCKTQQSVPEEQGQNAPQLAPPQATGSQTGAPVQTTVGSDLMGSGPINRDPIDRSFSNQPATSSQHDFDSPKGGCGCLLVGLLLAITAAPLSLLAACFAS